MDYKYNELTPEEYNYLSKIPKHSIVLYISISILIIFTLFMSFADDIFIWTWLPFCFISIFIIIAVSFSSSNSISDTLKQRKVKIVEGTIQTIDAERIYNSGSKSSDYIFFWVIDNKKYTIERRAFSLKSIEDFKLYNFAVVGDQVMIKFLIYSDIIFKISNLNTKKDNILL